MKVVTVAEMRDIEEKTVGMGITLDSLMEKAGLAVAEEAAGIHGQSQILVLVGPGNNGGDGLVAAKHLQGRGRDVAVYTFARKDVGDPSGNVQRAEDDSRQTGLRKLVGESGVIIDALLGIGQTRPPASLLQDVLETANARRAKDAVGIAVDIPTGVNADTGAVPGTAFQAEKTICMGFLKCGAVVYPGADFAGQAKVAPVGIPQELDANVKTSLPDAPEIAAMLPERKPNANKGTYGKALLIGGSRLFRGAPVLAALAAYRMGAGLVEIACPALTQDSIAAHVLEPVYNPLPDDGNYISAEAIPAIHQSLSKSQALIFGPGLGLSLATIEVTGAVLATLPDLDLQGSVFDADGLNTLAKIEGWWKYDAPMVLTPHPGEMSRLTGLSTADIQSDRLRTARRYAEEWDKVVVLKGAGTIVASPDGEARIIRTGGPNLATAGTGDVLSGMIGGLLAQGLRPKEAAIAGTYLHGMAGDLVRKATGDAGTIASDLIPKIPSARLSILDQGRGQQ